MHHYLHNATGSHSLCAQNGKSTFRFCTEYNIFPPRIQQKAIIPFVFPHNGLWIIVIQGWGWMEEKKRPSYLPFPVSASSLWIIDYRWERDFALQGGGYEAAWGLYQTYLKHSEKYPQNALSMTIYNRCFITQSNSVKDMTVNMQCHAFQYDKQLFMELPLLNIWEPRVWSSLLLRIKHILSTCSRLSHSYACYVEISVGGEGQWMITRLEETKIQTTATV